ncbi:MAG TPA: SDR family NAD(P)-dependent oxidoreductase, partial [Geminicoccaceae bacterium]
GKVGIITGGARGIGRATALRFLREGGRAVVLDLEDADGPVVADLREAAGDDATRLLYIAGDATDEGEVKRMVAAARAAAGPAQVLINNLGFGDRVVPLDQTTLATWNRFMTLNTTTTFLVTREVLPEMRAQKDGRIVNLSSITGRSISEVANVPYSASKAAVLGFTRKLAYEEGPNGIRVNAVAPGTVFTDRVRARYDDLGDAERDRLISAYPLRRVARPEEIAAAILFLASDDASYVTGAVLDVNGGRFMG